MKTLYLTLRDPIIQTLWIFVLYVLTVRALTDMHAENPAQFQGVDALEAVLAGAKGMAQIIVAGIVGWTIALLIKWAYCELWPQGSLLGRWVNVAIFSAIHALPFVGSSIDRMIAKKGRTWAMFIEHLKTPRREVGHCDVCGCICGACMEPDDFRPFHPDDDFSGLSDPLYSGK